MSQTLTVLVAEPDPAVARQQLVALQEMEDLALNVVLFQHADALDEVERVRPDMLLLRHERSGLTGFATVARLRKDPRIKSLPVLLTTTDATKDAIDRHRASATHADFYLLLPASRAELEEAVRMVATRARNNRSLMEAAGGGPLRPPKLPRSAPTPAFTTPWVQGSLSEVTMPGAFASVPVTGPHQAPATSPPPPQGNMPSMDELKTGIEALGTQSPSSTGGPTSTLDGLPAVPVTHTGADPTDAAFVQRVLTSMGGNAPEVTGEMVARMDAADPRVTLLRDKLKERERDLQRLARLWNAKEQEIKASETRVAQKESEVEGYLVQMSELRKEVQRLQGVVAEKEHELGASVEGMLTERVMMEKDLIEVVASKEKELHAMRRERREMEAAAEQLKGQLVSRIYEWEAAFHDLDARLQRTVAHGEAVLGDAYQRLDETRAALSQTRAQWMSAQIRADLLAYRLQETRAEHREQLWQVHDTRTVLMARVADLTQRWRITARLRKQEQAQALAVQRQLEEQLYQADLARQQWHTRMREVDRHLTNVVRDREDEIARLDRLLRNEAATRAQLAEDLQRLEVVAEELVFNLETDLLGARAEAGAVAYAWKRDVATRDDRIQALTTHNEQLTDELKGRELRLDEAKDLEATLQTENQRIMEAGEAAVREREERISALEARLAEEGNRLAALQERRAGVERQLVGRDQTIVELSARLDAAAQAHAELESRMGQAEALTRTLQIKLEDRERALTTRDEQLGMARAEQRAAREEVERLQNEVTSHTETLRARILEIRNLEASVQRKAQEIEEFEQGRALMQQQVARTEEAHQGVRRKLADALRTVSERESDIRGLRDELAAARDQVVALTGQLEDRQQALLQLEASLQEVDSRTAEATARERALTAEMDAQRAQVAAVRDTLAERDGSLKTARGRIADMEAERSELDAQVASVREELAAQKHKEEALVAQVDQGRAQLSAAQAEVASRTSEVRTLASRLQQAQTELENSQTAYQQRTEERDAAREELRQAGLDLDAARAEAREMHSQVASLKATLAASREVEQALAGQQGQAAHALTKVKKDMMALSEALEQRDAAIKNAEARLREREEALRTSQSAYEQLAQNHAEGTALATDLQRLQAEHEKQHAELTGGLEALRVEKEQVVAQLFDAQQALRQSEGQVRARQEALKVAQQAEAALRTQLAAERLEATDAGKQAEERARALRDEAAVLRKERDEASLTVQQLQQQVHRLEDATREQLRERTALSGREQALDRQFHDTRTRLSQQEALLAQGATERARLEAELEELRAALDAAVAARGVETEMRTRAQDERGRADAALKEAQTELESTQRKLDERTHEWERTQTRLETEIRTRTQTEHSLTQAQDHLAALETEGRTVGTQAQELEKARTQLAARSQQLERRVQELQDQLSRADRAAQDTLAEAQARMESQVQQMLNDREDAKRKLHESETARTRLEVAVRQANDEKDVLRRNAIKRIGQYEEKYNQAQVKMAEIEETAGQGLAAQKQIELLRAEANKARTERDALRREATSRLQSQQGRIGQLSRALQSAGVPVPPDPLSSSQNPTLAPPHARTGGEADPAAATDGGEPVT